MYHSLSFSLSLSFFISIKTNKSINQILAHLNYKTRSSSFELLRSSDSNMATKYQISTFLVFFWLLFSLCFVVFGQRIINYSNANNQNYQQQSYHIEQCMMKILDTIQECSQRAVQLWNLNHSLYVPSNLSTCCANWEVFNCFMTASLEYCTLLEFQALAWNMTNDALMLQRGSCYRFRYRSEVCSMYSHARPPAISLGMIIVIIIIVSLVQL